MLSKDPSFLKNLLTAIVQSYNQRFSPLADINYNTLIFTCQGDKKYITNLKSCQEFSLGCCYNNYNKMFSARANLPSEGKKNLDLKNQ